jgi:hypothetical protein
MGALADYYKAYTDNVSKYNTYQKIDADGNVVAATEAEFLAGNAVRALSEKDFIENLKKIQEGLFSNLGVLN